MARNFILGCTLVMSWTLAAPAVTHAAAARVQMVDPPEDVVKLGRGRRAKTAFPLYAEFPLTFDAIGPGNVVVDLRADVKQVKRAVSLRIERDGKYVSVNERKLKRGKGRRNVRASARIFIMVEEGTHRYKLIPSFDAPLFAIVEPSRRAPRRMLAAAEEPLPAPEQVAAAPEEPEPPAPPETPPAPEAQADTLAAAAAPEPPPGPGAPESPAAEGAPPAEAAPAPPAEPAPSAAEPAKPPVPAGDLGAATREALAKLPDLKIPAVDDDVLVFGRDYTVHAGTGRNSPILRVATSPQERAQAEGSGARSDVRLACADDEQCASECLPVATDGGGLDQDALDACAATYVKDHPALLQVPAEGIFAAHADGDLSSRVPLFASAQVRVFEERRTSAYSFEAEAYGSLTTASTDGGAWQTDAQGGLHTFKGTYRRYLDATDAPLYGMAAVDMNDAVRTYSSAANVDGWALPARLTLGFGRGRIYTLEPRVRLAKLEKILIDDGVISGPIPAGVARDIMLAWWVLRDELGYEGRLQHTLKILMKANLLVGEVSQATVYRFGRIFDDTQLAARRHGVDSYLALRAAKGVSNPDGPASTRTSPADGPWTFVLEARHEQVYNLSFDKELVLAAAVGIAPRDNKDTHDNTLPGATLALSSLSHKQWIFSVPVAYRHFSYDAFYNRTGAFGLRGRLALGGDGDSKDASVGVGGDYTVYSDAHTGYGFGLDLDVGYVSGKDALLYVVSGFFRIDFGSSEAFYVAPGALDGQLPSPTP